MNKYELKEFKYKVAQTILPLREGLWQLIDDGEFQVERINLDDGCFRIRMELNADFFIEIALEYIYGGNLQFFFHFCQWVSFNGYKPQAEEIPLKKNLVPVSVLNLGKYKNGKYLLNPTKTFPQKICELISKLTLHKNELLSACEKSTNYNTDGSRKRDFKSWKSKAVITKFYKRQGIVHAFQGISKGRQHLYDSSPFLHGSNGSYVENAPYEWVIDVRIKRVSYEIDECTWQTVNIHDYITTKLMSRLGWERITSQRLDWIKSILEKQQLDVITFQMHEAPINREFMPLNYNNSWEEYLNYIFFSAK